MKIGYLQFCPSFLQIDKTKNHLQKLLQDSRECDLLVLPELASTGYNFDSPKQALSCAEEMQSSKFLDFLYDFSKKNDVAVVAGYNEKCGDQLFNSAAVITADGVIGNYRKMHLFMNEKDYFAPGNSGLPVFTIKGVKVGVLICFDWQFPEIWRILALKGAQIVCHPSNLVLPGLAQRAVPLHSLLNRYYVITANRIGSEGNLTFTGRSIITDARGNTISEAPEKEEYLEIIDIDPSLALDKGVTPRNDLINDRRIEEYQEILKF